MAARHAISETYDNYKLSASLLTAAEERSLGRRVQAGRAAQQRLAAGDAAGVERRRLRRTIADGESARAEFIEANLRLVVLIARRRPRHPRVELDDVIQAGNIGLMTAVDRFDPDAGYRFSTYARNWIKQAIQRSEQEWSLVAIPHRILDEIRATIRAGYGVSGELAGVEAMRNPDLLQPAGADADTPSWLDWTPDETAETAFELVDRRVDGLQVRAAVSDVLAALPSSKHDDANIVELRHYRECSIGEVGEAHGISRGAANRRISRINDALRSDPTLRRFADAA